MGRRYENVSLLTDYGTSDEFVGVVKAVLADLAPHVRTIDLTHEVPPFDVRAGSLSLARACPYLPEGIVVAVVDPGVGTERKAVAVEVAGGAGVFVGPDNGLLAPAVAIVGGADRAVELTAPEYRLSSEASTFDGRDVFAPAAAHLASGVDLAELGPSIDPGLLMPGLVGLPRLEASGAELHGEVLWVDRFGNCQLNVTSEDIEPFGSPLAVTVAEPAGGTRQFVVHRAQTFADLGPSRLGAIVDSSGMIAVVADRRSAAGELGVGAGDLAVISALDVAPGTQPVAVTLGARPGRAALGRQ